MKIHLTWLNVRSPLNVDRNVLILNLKSLILKFSIFLTRVFLRNLFFFLRSDIFLTTRVSAQIIDSSNKVDVELLNDFRDPLQYKRIL